MALLGNEGSSLGALVPIKSDKTVAIGGQSGVETPPKRKVLHEDNYIESLEKIIQRDFFPDVDKLQAQMGYLEAEETGDLERMREIAIKFGSSLGKSSAHSSAPYVTPATFETPEGRPGSPSSKARHSARVTEEGGKEKDQEEKELPCLDSFLAKNTSEDNASFEQIMDLAEVKERARHAWLYEAESEFKQRHTENLALPSAEKQAVESGKAGVETWEYKAKNALMYYPDGVKDDESFKKPREVLHKNTRFQGDPFSKALSKTQLQQAAALNAQRHTENLALPSAEKQAVESGKAGVETWEYKAKNALMYYPDGVKDDESFKKPREVLHKNTRFQGDPFSKALSKTQLQQAAALNAQFKQGKVGPDGKDLLAQDSPKVNGYGFLGTPSPAPGVTDSPLMTWGEIESTPFRLDASDTPYVERTRGPSFKIPAPGRRERLGLKMANEAAAKNRANKQEALRKVTENLASLTPKGLSPALSPALQRLVNRTASKYTDKALRASYTPSPAHSGTPGCKTPAGLNTPSGTPTPSGTARTPATQDPASITDNLLQLPKRRKAADFF
ncbi:ESS2 factor, partial [Polyodon spathula]|nr:ESS2 factor [Polyodon spathula]